jgi:hypothetical protein
MSNPFSIAADHLLTLKPQFQRLTNCGWSCEASYWLPAVPAQGFNDWEPVWSEAPDSDVLRSVGLLLEPRQLAVSPGEKPPPWAFEARWEGETGSFFMAEPACYRFDIHRTGLTASDCDAGEQFATAAKYTGNCLRSVDLSRLRFADVRTPLATGEPDAFWLLVLFDLAWQRRPGAGLTAKRNRVWRRAHATVQIPYEWTSAHLTAFSGKYSGTPTGFYDHLLAQYPDKLPECFVSHLDGITVASALAIDILVADLRRLAEAFRDRKDKPRPAVVLRGESEPPLINGRSWIQKLTRTRYKVIAALLQSFPGRLGKDALVRMSGVTDAVNVLKLLAKKDGWKDVIELAGEPGHGYGIRHAKDSD